MNQIVNKYLYLFSLPVVGVGPALQSSGVHFLSTQKLFADWVGKNGRLFAIGWNQNESGAGWELPGSHQSHPHQQFDWL